MARTTSRVGVGEALAMLGAGVLFADLFQPWYEFRLPPDALGKLGSGGGPLAEFLREGLRVLANVGPVPITAWQAFHGLDAALAALAAGVAVLVLMRATGREDALGLRAPGAVVAAGTAAMALIAYRMADRPGPSEVLHLRAGAWVGLGAAAAMALGGWLSARPRGAQAPATPAWEPLPSATGSLPPPGT